MKKMLFLPIIFLIIIFNCKSENKSLLTDNGSLLRIQKANIYYKKGRSLISEQKFNDALKYLKLAIKNDPSGNCVSGFDGMAYNEIGYIFFLTKDYEKALINFNKCIEINPNNQYALFNKANMYIAKNEWDKALETINNLFRLNVYNYMAYFHRGYIYENLKDYNNALNDYEKFLQISELYENDSDIHKLRETAKEAVYKIKSKTTD